MVKGPKFLNPADKARKEARKKELKKNKKQRLQVRSAAIERKDPEQVIADLEKLDRFEFDIETNPSLSDTFYKDKRKRLKETWSKILAYYEKDDPDRHSNLKKVEADYETKHKRLAKEFEAIKAAQEVKIEDVFLPPEPTAAADEIADDDPLLSDSVYITPLSEGMKPPGCPPGLPPDLKAIVESLKTSLVAQIAQATQPLPPNLINLRLSRSGLPNQGDRSQHPTYRNRPRTDFDRNRSGQNIPRQARNQQTQKEPQTSKGAISTKSTVIESQPVIFKPKVTKFVPSSVRSKLTQGQKDQ